jgi:predicted protein tyrosine phosphatase
MDLNQISARLYVGSCPRQPQDAETLQKAHGVSAVLSLQSEDDLRYWQIDWDAMSARYAELGVVVRRVPVLDFNADDLRRRLPECVHALGDLLDRGHCVYVHCNSGVNRSPSTIIAYLHWIEGWDLLQAARHVQACRRCEPYLPAIIAATEDRTRAAANVAGEGASSCARFADGNGGSSRTA